MRNKREKLAQIVPELDEFIVASSDFPFNLKTAEILLSAFATHLGTKEIINEDEYFGMLISAVLIKKLVEKAK